MVIRVFLFFVAMVASLLKGQDSAAVRLVNKEYGRYYQTYIKAVSPSGKYLVKHNWNAYGMDDFFLVSIATGTSTVLPKGKAYTFTNDRYLIIEMPKQLIFYDTASNQSTSIAGYFKVSILDSSVIAYSPVDKRLFCFTRSGQKVWKRDGVRQFEYIKERYEIAFLTEDSLYIIDVAGTKERTMKLGFQAFWMQASKGVIWLCSEKYGLLTLSSFDIGLKSRRDTSIQIPEAYELVRSKEFFEVREDRYFILSLIRRRKPAGGQNVKISYTIKNASIDRDQLAIYDTVDSLWSWLPKSKDENNVSFFISEKGDFITYNLAEDIVENKKNPLLNVKMVRNYGRSVISLGEMHTDSDNFYFDDDSNQLMYFKDRQWWLRELVNDRTISLSMPSRQLLVEPGNTGLHEWPVLPVMKTSETSKVIVSGIYDLFLVDLNTHVTKRLTDGEKDHVRYRFAVKPMISGYGWKKVKSLIDLNKDNLLQLFGERDFQSGFSYLRDNKLRTIIYGDYNFRHVLTNGNSIFAVSQKYQKPLEVFDVKYAKADRLYTDNAAQSNYDPSLKIKMLHYSYKSIESNAVLLFPKDYDPAKKYPMMVNVYEDTSKNILENNIPSLYASDGFNYLHYLRQGYFVLLPQLQYEFQKVHERYIGSLEAAVNKALLNGSIDKGRLAITGLSFGGYESGLAMGMSKLFRTASIGVMISDMISYSFSYTNLFNNPNYIRAETQQHALSSSPFDKWELYNRYSPLYHLKNVNQPVLIWGGSKDKNVPPSQSIAYFLGLKRLSKPAVLLEYTEEQHQIVDPVNQQDLSVRTWQWMEYYLKGNPPAEWIRPIIEKAP